jgi:RNA polymerase sigma-70 factor, ECF subfamily
MAQDFVLGVFEKNFKKVYRYFYYKTFSKEEAEDLTSETFLQFLKQAHQHENSIDKPDSYLYGIAQNIFRTFLRTKYKLPLISMFSLPEFAQELENVTEDKIIDMKAKLKELIAQLPEKQKEIIQLRLVEGKTITEIMQLTGKNNNYVKTTQKRAIRNLKKLLACTPVAT